MEDDVHAQLRTIAERQDIIREQQDAATTERGHLRDLLEAIIERDDALVTLFTGDGDDSLHWSATIVGLRGQIDHLRRQIAFLLAFVIASDLLLVLWMMR